MPHDQPMGAHVEIIEPFTERAGVDLAELDSLPIIKPSVVRVNGTDVGLIEKGSLVIDPGNFPDRATRVTFTLVIKSLTIKAE
jgi:hypothetical protein